MSRTVRSAKAAFKSGFFYCPVASFFDMHQPAPGKKGPVFALKQHG